jgi:class 3 adenylate cyclase/TolB-like protein/Flp pilus assembly protein TadD
MRMTLLLASHNMPSNPSDVPVPVFRREARTVVVVDLVESVRLYELDEEGMVRLWQLFVRRTSDELLPRHAGRLVKSTGDGLIVEFETVPPAIQCAHSMQDLLASLEPVRSPDRAVFLRAGVHVADVYVDQHDIYGRGVNLAARLASLARPDEVVVSAEVNDRLVPGLDADVEDLGECFLKHVAQPVRAYRILRSASERGRHAVSPMPSDSRASLAVLPLSQQGPASDGALFGDALADELIAAFSRVSELHVISRLSSSGFRDRNFDLQQVRQALAVDYVLSGGFIPQGDTIRVHLELAETRSGRVVWSDSVQGTLRDAFSADSELVRGVVSTVCSRIIATEVQRVRTRPLATLESYALLFAAVTLMHRTVAADFARARELLEHLSERSGRHPVAQSWLAKWHVMRVQQGWSEDVKLDASAALDHTRRALDSDPECTLAMAVGGFVHCNLRRDFDAAAALYARALELNPNESLAWLFTGTLHAFKGEGEEAMFAADKALRLSPLDPTRYFYDSLAATAAVSAGQYERAIDYARRSLKGNRMHTSTYRALAIAQSLSGQMDEANQTIAELLRLEPGYTVRSFLERAAGAAFPIGQRFAQALKEAGLPP